MKIVLVLTVARWRNINCIWKTSWKYIQLLISWSRTVDISILITFILLTRLTLFSSHHVHIQPQKHPTMSTLNHRNTLPCPHSATETPYHVHIEPQTRPYHVHLEPQKHPTMYILSHRNTLPCPPWATETPYYVHIEPQKHPTLSTLKQKHLCKICNLNKLPFRSLYLEYDTDRTVFGVDLYRFSTTASLFQNHSVNPDNGAFCGKDKCWGTGLLPLSSCQKGSKTYNLIIYPYNKEIHHTVLPEEV